MLVEVAANAKACTEALGLAGGLETIAEVGFGRVVVWAGEEGQWLRGVATARERGLEVVGVCLPKRHSADPGLVTLAHAVAAYDVPAVALIFGDRPDEGVEPAARCLDRLQRVLSCRILVENAGRSTEAFSDLAALARLLARAPWVGAIFDLGHLLCTRAGFAGIDAILPRVAWVDLHENDGAHDLHRPVGHGVADGCCAPWLVRLGLDRHLLVLESDARQGTDPDGWVRAMRWELGYLRALLGGRDRRP